MHTTWDPPRVMRALATLRDNGVSVRQMTAISGANRSTIYRWMSGGEGRPDYAIITSLAAALWRDWPHEARELVEGSGYPWREPDAVPEPPPVPPEVLRVIRAADRDEDWKRAAIEALEAIGRPAAELGAGARRRAG